jgi:hypothetical protein
LGDYGENTSHTQLLFQSFVGGFDSLGFVLPPPTPLSLTTPYSLAGTNLCQGNGCSFQIYEFTDPANPTAQALGNLTVSTVELSISGVPEPSTWAMMLLGFMGVGFLAYRRKPIGPSLRLA